MAGPQDLAGTKKDLGPYAKGCGGVTEIPEYPDGWHQYGERTVMNSGAACTHRELECRAAVEMQRDRGASTLKSKKRYHSERDAQTHQQCKLTSPGAFLVPQ